MPTTPALSAKFRWSGYLIGFALGGFFDGILLHQILQWHHLLSSLEQLQDIQVQILADGVFHALMYIIAVIGLWILLRKRGELALPLAAKVLFSNTLMGFGVWHIIDAILSHWITGIHRIRMDSPNPLMWDIIWLVAFGLIPLFFGLWMRRKGGPGVVSGRAAACILGLALLGGGYIASLPPPNVSQVMVYFRPGTLPQAVFAAAEAVDARIIWSDKSGTLWAFDLGDRRSSKALYRYGALFVGTGAFPIGCLSWSRA